MPDIPIYRMTWADRDEFPVWARVQAVNDLHVQNWWTYDVIARSDFEDADHLLEAVGPNYEPESADDCPDISQAATSIWAFSERAWNWLPQLKASGCRVAEKVTSERGSKRFRLVYPAPIVDLLDHDRSEYDREREIVTNIKKYWLYEYRGVLPLMFHLLRKHPTEYRGVTTSPTLQTFVTQSFVDEYNRRGLTGVRFIRMDRSERPAGVPEPENVVVYRP